MSGRLYGAGYLRRLALDLGWGRRFYRGRMTRWLPSGHLIEGFQDHDSHTRGK
jgi:hypothetical protein